MARWRARHPHMLFALVGDINADVSDYPCLQDMLDSNVLVAVGAMDWPTQAANTFTCRAHHSNNNHNYNIQSLA